MLRLPPFRYLSPQTLRQAAQMLADGGPEAMPIAGGTDLLPNMKHRLCQPKLLVGLGRVEELKGFRGDARQGLTIGAGTALAQVATHPAVVQGYPALARAAGLVATPVIRNMGTIGGNLCLSNRCPNYNRSYFWRQALGFCLRLGADTCRVNPEGDRCMAISSADTATVAVALGATLRLVSQQGERLVGAADFYRDDGMHHLAKAPQELVAEVILPPADGLRSTYWKLRRRTSLDFPLLGVAVALRLEGDICREARIVLGAIASRPVEVEGAARALLGQRLTPEAIAEAAHLAYQGAYALDDYRRRMVRVYVARALGELAG